MANLDPDPIPLVDFVLSRRASTLFASLDSDLIGTRRHSLAPQDHTPIGMLEHAGRQCPHPVQACMTYCLGGHFTISADLDVPSSEAVWSAFE